MDTRKIFSVLRGAKGLKVRSDDLYNFIDEHITPNMLEAYNSITHNNRSSSPEYKLTKNLGQELDLKQTSSIIDNVVSAQLESYEVDKSEENEIKQEFLNHLNLYLIEAEEQLNTQLNKSLSVFFLFSVNIAYSIVLLD